MKLDVTCMRYLSKDDYRVLTAVEMGMRNHEIVPVQLITSIAKLRHGGSYRILSTLLRHKLVAHSNTQYDGYRLSYMGFDILALRTLLARKVIISVGRQIGIGKESDIFEALDENENEVVIKIHRLGRTSFRSVRKNRDYMVGKSKANWLYMSRLAATKEYAFMQALYSHGFPTPTPIDQNRHVVVMSRIPGVPLAQLRAGTLPDAERIFAYCMAMLKRLAEHGLVHCDFNEFNLMGDDNLKITLIDFPQMISTSHPNASELFTRDVNCLVKFFAMKMHYIPPEHLIPVLSDIQVSDVHLDEQVHQTQIFTKEEAEDLNTFLLERIKEGEENENEDDENENDSDDDNDVINDNDEEGTDQIEKNTDNKTGSNIKASFEKLHLDDDNIESIKQAQHDDNSEEGSDLSDDQNGYEGNEQSEEANIFVSERKLRQLKDQVRYNMNKRGGKSRNATKKRNKYGKIDRVDKLDF